jgi:hypothetical protein
MNRLIELLLRFIGGAAALIGASLVAWQSVAIYYLITGRVQADAEQPPLGVVTAILIFGVFLLILGYAAQKSAVRRSAIERSSPEAIR